MSLTYPRLSSFRVLAAESAQADLQGGDAGRKLTIFQPGCEFAAGVPRLLEMTLGARLLEQINDALDRLAARSGLRHLELMVTEPAAIASRKLVAAQPGSEHLKPGDEDIGAHTGGALRVDAKAATFEVRMTNAINMRFKVRILYKHLNLVPPAQRTVRIEPNANHDPASLTRINERLVACHIMPRVREEAAFVVDFNRAVHQGNHLDQAARILQAGVIDPASAIFEDQDDSTQFCAPVASLLRINERSMKPHRIEEAYAVLCVAIESGFTQGGERIGTVLNDNYFNRVVSFVVGGCAPSGEEQRQAWLRLAANKMLNSKNWAWPPDHRAEARMVMRLEALRAKGYRPATTQIRCLLERHDLRIEEPLSWLIQHGALATEDGRTVPCVRHAITNRADSAGAMLVEAGGTFSEDDLARARLHEMPRTVAAMEYRLISKAVAVAEDNMPGRGLRRARI